MKKVVIKGVLIAALLFTPVVSASAETYYQFDEGAFSDTQATEKVKEPKNKEEKDSNDTDLMTNTDTVTLQYPDTVLEKHNTVTKDTIIQDIKKLSTTKKTILATIVFALCVFLAVVLRRHISYEGRNHK